MKITIETVYLNTEHPRKPEKVILAGVYDHVLVHIDGVVTKRYGSYRDRGEEKATAFTDGIKYALPNQTVDVDYKSTVMK